MSDTHAEESVHQFNPCLAIALVQLTAGSYIHMAPTVVAAQRNRLSKGSSPEVTGAFSHFYKGISFNKPTCFLLQSHKPFMDLAVFAQKSVNSETQRMN